MSGQFLIHVSYGADTNLMPPNVAHTVQHSIVSGLCVSAFGGKTRKIFNKSGKKDNVVEH